MAKHNIYTATKTKKKKKEKELSTVEYGKVEYGKEFSGSVHPHSRHMLLTFNINTDKEQSTSQDQGKLVPLMLNMQLLGAVFRGQAQKDIWAQNIKYDHIYGHLSALKPFPLERHVIE